MLNRREFVRLTALASAAGCSIGLPRGSFAAASGMTYGVQLFMVRRQAQQDLAGVLKAIHQVGFAQVELYPIVYNRPAGELKQMVADAGLGLVSAHFDYVGFEGKIDYARQLGLKYMVCPMIPHDQWGSTAGYAKAAEEFNHWGAKMKDAGMEFAFHNHCYEFKPQADGVTGWQTLMSHTDAKLVKLELDCYWLAQGGQDPLTVLKRYADRARLIHLKDRTADAPVSYTMGPGAQHFTELGKGVIHWQAILEQAYRQGIRYSFLDQDETSGPVLTSMAESYAYLKTLHIG